MANHPAQEAAAPAVAPAQDATTFQDAELAASQLTLLEMAYATASAIPLNPFIKTRSTAQEKVFDACLELDQPSLAGRYLEGIENWRKGSCLALLSIYQIRHGVTDDVARHMEQASVIAGTTEDWRRDTIRVKLAEAHKLLGDETSAEQFTRNMGEVNMGKATVVDAAVEIPFEDQVEQVKALVASESFDVIKNGLGEFAELYDRIYEDADKRNLVEEQIRSSWSKMPIFIRVDLIMQLADHAAAHGDQAKATGLADDVQKYLDEMPWELEARLAMASKLASLRYRAGAVEAAQTQAAQVLALYKEQGSQIVNIYRARALRPLAEAYQAMGDTEKAGEVYALAVEEGVANPNSVPRAEDLSATCLSMALNNFEPSDALLARMKDIQGKLGAPW